MKDLFWHKNFETSRRKFTTWVPEFIILHAAKFFKNRRIFHREWEGLIQNLSGRWDQNMKWWNIRDLFSIRLSFVFQRNVISNIFPPTGTSVAPPCRGGAATYVRWSKSHQAVPQGLQTWPKLYIGNEAQSDVNTSLYGCTSPRWKMTRIYCQNIFLVIAIRNRLSSGTCSTTYRWWSLIVFNCQLLFQRLLILTTFWKRTPVWWHGWVRGFIVDLLLGIIESERNALT